MKLILWIISGVVYMSAIHFCFWLVTPPEFRFSVINWNMIILGIALGFYGWSFTLCLER